MQNQGYFIGYILLEELISNYTAYIVFMSRFNYIVL